MSSPHESLGFRCLPSRICAELSGRCSMIYLCLTVDDHTLFSVNEIYAVSLPEFKDDVSRYVHKCLSTCQNLNYLYTVFIMILPKVGWGSQYSRRKVQKKICAQHQFEWYAPDTVTFLVASISRCPHCTKERPGKTPKSFADFAALSQR